MHKKLTEELRDSLDGEYTNKEYEIVASVLKKELEMRKRGSNMIKIEQTQEKINITDRRLDDKIDSNGQQRSGTEKIDPDVAPEGKIVDGQGNEQFGIR